MTNLLMILLCLSLTNAVSAQNPFQNISLEKALQKAQKENKLIFLQYESAECAHCNNVAGKAFANNDFSKRLATEFIAIKISPESKDRRLISDEYGMGDGFGTLFIDGNGKLIYVLKSTSSQPKTYEIEILNAYNRQQSFKTLEEKEYAYFNSSNKNVQDLEQLIQAKTNLNLSTDLLLTEYINLIPKDSINSMRVLQFLIKQAPVYRSKSDLAMRSSKNFRDAWNTFSSQDKIRNNREIIEKSINIAAQNRDERQALAIASFAMSTTDAGARQNTYDKNMMRYYALANDTAKYLAIAITYLNRYTNTLTDEFIKKIDSIERKKAFANPVKVENLGLMENGKQMERRTVSYTPPSNTYSLFLYQSANYFSNMDKNNTYIEHAIKWAQRSVEISVQPMSMYILSNLLYEGEKYEEAVETMEKAIELTRKLGYEQKKWNATLDKMKQRQPLD